MNIKFNFWKTIEYYKLTGLFVCIFTLSIKADIFNYFKLFIFDTNKFVMVKWEKNWAAHRITSQTFNFKKLITYYRNLMSDIRENIIFSTYVFYSKFITDVIVFSILSQDKN